MKGTIIRRGSTYGPRLEPGLLEDDGADRGLIFVALNAHIARQFEFVQEQWINDGRSMGAPEEVDPLVASHAEHDTFTIPQRPIHRRLRGLPSFVRNRFTPPTSTPEPINTPIPAPALPNARLRERH